MIKSVTVENYLGDETTITLNDPDPENGFLIKSITGLGPVKGAVNFTNYGINDGAAFTSARLEKRNIVFNIQFHYIPDIETARQNSYKYFPVKHKVHLIFETDNRLCETFGYVESNEPNIFDKEESCQISILCEDPYFYEVGANNPQKTIFSEITPLFEFPFDNNDLDERVIEISKYELDKEKILVYEGDAEVGVKMTAHILGSVGDIYVYNFFTKENMVISNSKISSITGHALQASDDVIISTDEFNIYAQLVRAGRITNILNAVDRDSDWFKLRKGNNIFAFTTSNNTDENIIFTIENRVRFAGI